MPAARTLRSIATFTVLVLAFNKSTPAQTKPSEWPAYGRDALGGRFSPLTQITRDNVSQLAVAWTYRTG